MNPCKRIYFNVRSTSEVIEKIVSYIQANYMNSLTVDDLSH